MKLIQFIKEAITIIHDCSNIIFTLAGVYFGYKVYIAFIHFVQVLSTST